MSEHEQQRFYVNGKACLYWEVVDREAGYVAATVEKDVDDSNIADAEKIALKLTEASMVNQWRSRAEASKARIAELEAALREAREARKELEAAQANAAAMREAAIELDKNIWKVQDWNNTTIGESSAKLDAALDGTAGRALLEEVERLRSLLPDVAEACLSVRKSMDRPRRHDSVVPASNGGRGKRGRTTGHV